MSSLLFSQRLDCTPHSMLHVLRTSQRTILWVAEQLGPGRLVNQIEVAMDKILPIGVYTSAGAPNPRPAALLRGDSRNEA